MSIDMSENIVVENSQATSCCGSCGGAEASSEQSSPVGREVFRVQGMTCGHCVDSVSRELGKIESVKAVGVDLPTGQVTVDSDTPLSDETVAKAIDEAGYEFAGRVGA
jgi:copper ion binding protein